MFKKKKILITVLAIFMSSIFFASAEKVTIKSTARLIDKAGAGFIIEFTINKGSINGIAQLNQELPEGFTATPLETEKAKFSIEGNTLKFVWLKLPKDRMFKVSYKIQYDQSLSGERLLTGSFSYLDKEKSKESELTPLKLNLSSSTYLSTDGNKNVHPEVDRKIISLSPDASEYKVELTIQRKVEQTAACFIDQLPAGYRATPAATEGAKFINEDNLVIFSWAKLPDQPVFKVEYSIKAGVKQKSAPVISGILVYGSDAEIAMKMHSQKSDAALTTADETQSVIDEANKLLGTLTAGENKLPELKPAPVAPAMVAINKGVYYKVQIAATRQSPERDENYFLATYGLAEHVDLVMHHGWKKYFVGTFDNLEAARKYQTLVKTIFTDAYVVGFDKGELKEIRDAQQSASMTNQ